MAGLVPAIHVFPVFQTEWDSVHGLFRVSLLQDVDARGKPGHDEI
jgi:hypothetical protein